MTAQSRSVVVRLTAETAQYIAQMQAAGTMTATAMTKAERSTMSQSKALNTMGTAGGRAGLVAAAGLAAIVMTSARFDKAMSSVQAATHETASTMDDLRSAAVKAGADTVFSATDAAGAIENLAKAGVATQDILGGGLSGSLDLAAAGELDVADAAEIAATALTQFKLEGKDIPHVADLLAAGAGKAQGEVSDLSMALKQSGLVASQMGLSIEETVGTLASFASAGLLGSDAGTSFRTMLLRLANPTAESSDLMKSLGIAAYDAQGNFVGMASVAEQLKTAFEGKTQAERDSALATIFGSDAIRAASVLYSQGAQGIDDWKDKVNDSGYAAETAGIKLDNLAGDFEAFKGSLETALIGAGDGSQGPLRDLVQGATAAVNAFGKLPAPIQGTATSLLAITAITGGSLWFGAKVINGVTNLRSSLAQLAPTGTRAGTALAGLAKAGLALAALDVASAVLDTLEQKAAGAAPEVEALTTALIHANDANFASQFAGIGDALNNIDKSGFDGFVQDYTALGDKVPVVGKALSQGLGAFVGISDDMQLSGVEAKKSAAAFESLDAALSGLVASGGPDRAKAAFADLAAQQNLSGDQQKQLLTLLPQYGEALSGAANAADLAAESEDGLAGATEGTTGAVKKETASLRENIAAMQAKHDAALAAFDAETAYGQAVVKAREQVKTGEKGLDKFTEAGQHNRQALSELAGAWNNQSKAVQNTDGRYQAARKTFIDVATQMTGSRDKAVLLAKALLDIPPKRIAKVGVDAGDSMATINGIQFAIDKLKSKTVYLTTVGIRTGAGGQGNGYGPSARGNMFASVAYAGGGMDKANAHAPEMTSGGITRVWNEPETGGESYIPHANDARRPRAKSILADTAAMFGGRVEWYAGGGIGFGQVGAGHGGSGSMSTEDALAIAQALKEIRDLRRQLNADGKDKLEGLNRRIAQLQLEAAEKELRLAKTREAREARQAEAETRRNVRGLMSGFSLDNVVPDETPATAAGQVAAELEQLKASILDAGGTWTKAMRAWAADLVATAAELDTVKASLAAETAKRDALVETLAGQQQALDQLTSTMQSYSASVAGNFLHDAFNGAHTVNTPAGAGGGPQSAALSAAEAQLAAIRNSPGGDSVEAAATASRLIAQIAALREGADVAAQPAEQTVSGLQSLHDTLVEDTAAAEAMSAALATLADKGLDTTGTLGGLYQQLAASGDVATAEELAALSAEQIDEYEKLFAAREDAAALVAAQATQAVYGQQQAELTALISATTDAIVLSEATIAVLNGQIAVLGEQVRQGAQDGMEPVKVEMGGIRRSVRGLARDFAEQAKKQKV